MQWYRRMAWCLYPRNVVLGMGGIQAAVSFRAWAQAFANCDGEGEGARAFSTGREARNVHMKLYIIRNYLVLYMQTVLIM